MAIEEDRAIEDRLEVQLQKRKNSLAASSYALACDSSNPELLLDVNIEGDVDLSNHEVEKKNKKKKRKSGANLAENEGEGGNLGAQALDAENRNRDKKRKKRKREKNVGGSSVKSRGNRNLAENQAEDENLGVHDLGAKDGSKDKQRRKKEKREKNVGDGLVRSGSNGNVAENEVEDENLGAYDLGAKDGSKDEKRRKKGKREKNVGDSSVRSGGNINLAENQAEDVNLGAQDPGAKDRSKDEKRRKKGKREKNVGDSSVSSRGNRNLTENQAEEENLGAHDLGAKDRSKDEKRRKKGKREKNVDDSSVRSGGNINLAENQAEDENLGAHDPGAKARSKDEKRRKKQKREKNVGDSSVSSGGNRNLAENHAEDENLGAHDLGAKDGSKDEKRREKGKREKKAGDSSVRIGGNINLAENQAEDENLGAHDLGAKDRSKDDKRGKKRKGEKHVGDGSVTNGGIDGKDVVYEKEKVKHSRNERKKKKKHNVDDEASLKTVDVRQGNDSSQCGENEIDKHSIEGKVGDGKMKYQTLKNREKVKSVKKGSQGKIRDREHRINGGVEGTDPSEKSAPRGTSKKVSFSEEVEVFPSSDDPSNEEAVQKEELVRGKRFSLEEDEMVKTSVLNYINSRNLGEEGLKMVLQCKKYPEIKNCWKEIGAALPWRPYMSVYYRAHVLFERDEKRSWTPEECELVQKFHEKYGSDWKTLAEALGKHRFHVKDTWRRIKFTKRNKGHWSQEEYQTLFDLVNMDLRMRAFEERKTKHGMLRDNIRWTAISDKLETRTTAVCCMKWYDQLTSPMVAEGEWLDVDDYYLVMTLYELDACCMEDVDWDNLLEHRPGDICRKRWNQMVKHLAERGNQSFSDQVEILMTRYCPDVLEARETYNSKPSVD